jgi:HlyD family secretion protein
MPMRLRHASPIPFAFLLPAAVALLLLAVGVRTFRNVRSSAETWTVVRSDIEEWIPLSSKLEAANPVTFRAELDGLSKLTFLAEDGTPVAEGDLLAGFDRSDLEERRRNLQRDLDIARANLISLRDAKHPLELQRIEQDTANVESELRNERLYQSEIEALVEEGLLAAEELDVYRQKIAALQTRKHALEEQWRLTETVLHPAALQIARARQKAAEESLADTEEKLQATRVTAPTAGTVHLPTIPIDGERRPARVGDGLYRNQVYLQLADLNDLVIRAEIGERLLARVVPGMEALVRIPAFPDRTERARIASVGAYPRGAERRYPVELHWIDPPADLRPGLTATLQVLSGRHEDVLAVPRRFLDWQGGDLFVHTPEGRRRVVPGKGNARTLIITEGIEEGETLITP